MFLSHIEFLSLSSFLPLSLKSISISLGVEKEKKIQILKMAAGQVAVESPSPSHLGETPSQSTQEQSEQPTVPQHV